MTQAGVEPVRICMLIVEVRGCAETGFTIEGVRVGPIDHEFVHTAAEKVEDGGLELAVGHCWIFRCSLQAFIGCAATGAVD